MSRRFNILNAPNGFVENQFYTAWKSVLATEPTGVYQTALNTFFQTLDDGNFLGVSPANATGRRVEYMFMFAGFSTEAGLTNLIDPTHTATAVNSPSWVQGEGYEGDSTAYINSNFQDNLGTYYLYQDAFVGSVTSEWIPSNGTSSVGVYNGSSNGTSLVPRRLSSASMGLTMQSSNDVSVATTNSGIGFYGMAKRVNTEEFFENGSSVGTPGLNNFSTRALNHFFMCVNKATVPTAIMPTNSKLNFTIATDGLIASEVATINTALKTYFTSVGVINPIP